MDNEFTTWLYNKLQEKDFSMNKLARLGGISHGIVSQVMNGKQSPSRDFCAAIAGPLGVSEAEVLWRAGLLDKKPFMSDEPHLVEMIDLFRELAPNQQQDIITLARLMKSDSITVQIGGPDWNTVKAEIRFRKE